MAIADAPTFDHRLVLYLTAYSELHTERAIGMGGAGLVPWSKIKEWAEFYDIPDKEDFIWTIQQMDIADSRTRKPNK